MMIINMDTGSHYVGMRCTTHATSLDTFKQRLDKHHPAPLQSFASLAVIHDSGLTYLLRDNDFAQSISVLRRSVMVSRHIVCLLKNTIGMCNKKRIFGILMMVWQE